MDNLTKQVEKYWDSHHLGTQFLPKKSAEIGSKEYFMQYDQAMERWEYKNHLIDWIRLQAQTGNLLEVGCGLGHDLVKFAAHGLSVTGVDLAKSVATMAKKHLEAYGLDGSTLQVNAESLSFRVMYST
jgi:ubiquinone/menaquinone biosynthesis C-methylase UbiE